MNNPLVQIISVHCTTRHFEDQYKLLKMNFPYQFRMLLVDNSDKGLPFQLADKPDVNYYRPPLQTNAWKSGGSVSHAVAFSYAYERIKSHPWDYLFLMDSDIFLIRPFDQDLFNMVNTEGYYGQVIPAQDERFPDYLWAGLVCLSRETCQKATPNIMPITSVGDTGISLTMPGGSLYGVKLAKGNMPYDIIHTTPNPTEMNDNEYYLRNCEVLDWLWFHECGMNQELAKDNCEHEFAFKTKSDYSKEIRQLAIRGDLYELHRRISWYIPSFCDYDTFAQH